MSLSPTHETWLRRVATLHQWSRGGERAPHKPLLLLYAIGRLEQTGQASVSFTEAEEPLRRLLEEFGPPRKTSPGYPFHHLASDGLWTVTMPASGESPGSDLRKLRAGAVGSLAADFATALERDPALLGGVVRTLLDSNFPASLHEDILSATGIDLEPAEALTLVPRRRRDPAFRELVLLAYEQRCAVCGYDGQLLREAVGIDAAHIRWWAENGPDEVENGVALCALHHKLFDRGAIGITEANAVAVSAHFVGRGTAAVDLVVALAGRALLAPQSGQPRPHPSHCSWHRAQVFRGPARQASR